MSYITIPGGTNYILRVSPAQFNLQNNEIRFICKTSTGPITIYLPEIINFGCAVSTKIFVDDADDNASANNITVVSTVANTIENTTSYVMNQNGSKIEIFISSQTEYGILAQGSSTPSSSSIFIPKPLIQIGVFNSSNLYNDLYSFYLPFTGESESFLSHQPKYYLFMARTARPYRKKILGVPTKKFKKGSYYHPTHQDGINFPNGAFYSGSTAIPLDTEYTFGAGAYNKTLLAFNPLQFMRYSDQSGPSPIWVVPDASRLNESISFFKFQGKHGNFGKRVVNFKLAIGIKNPNTAVGQPPIIFGELSEIFRISMRVERQSPTVVGFKGINIAIQDSGVRIKN
jgi:hypothetical protein